MESKVLSYKNVIVFVLIILAILGVVVFKKFIKK